MIRSKIVIALVIFQLTACSGEVVPIATVVEDFSVDPVFVARGEGSPFIASDDFGPRPEKLVIVVDLADLDAEREDLVKGTKFEENLVESKTPDSSSLISVTLEETLVLEHIQEYLGGVSRNDDVDDSLREWFESNGPSDELVVLAISANGS